MSTVIIQGKEYKKEFVAQEIANNPKWMARTIIRIYERQTADEKCINRTRNSNGIGFNQADAFIFSKIARSLLAGTPLQPWQIKYATQKNVRGVPRISKYAGQIMNIMAAGRA